MLLAGASCAQQWTQLADFPGTARDDAASFTISGGGPGITYVGTGMEVGWGLTNDWWRFDGSSWQQVASMPSSPRQYCSGVEVNNKGYVFGGTDANGPLNELWRYDPALDQWEEMTPLPGEGRYAAAVLSSDGSRILVTYGMLANGMPTKEAWYYHVDSDSWSVLPDAPEPARHRAAAGSSYIAGGMDDAGNVLSDTWHIDFTGPTPTWFAMPNLPEPRFGARIAFAFVIGGASSWTEIHDNVWSLSFSDWTVLDPFPGGPRRGGAIGVISGLSHSIFFGTGLDESLERQNDWWRMDLPSSVHELQNEALTISPNPATDVVLFAFTPTNGTAIVTVIDATGKTVRSFSSLAINTINIADLPGGCYTVFLQQTDQHRIGRFIKLP